MLEIITNDSRSRARVGRLTTPHGVVETPSYVIVGTDAAVRCLEPEDIPGTKTQIIIANTYHLWRTLRDEGLNDYPGLHEEMGWQGPLMTDSGGFQVFSFGFGREHGRSKILVQEDAARAIHEGENLVRVTESGVYFMDPSTGSGHSGGEELYLDAEISIKIQEQLGADIMLAFDECASPLNDHVYHGQAMERTHRWAERSLEAKTSEQFLYGIVQGGGFEDLRKKSAEFIGALPFDGFAVGGSFGKNEMGDVLRWVCPLLREDKPRHLLGVGRIEDILAAVEHGVDTFDCVIPTREARHGSLWTSRGRYDVTKGKYKDDGGTLDEECDCPTCSTEGMRRKDLYALFKDKDQNAGRLATMHNVYFFNHVMEQIRESIRGGRFLEFKHEYLKNVVR